MITTRLSSFFLLSCLFVTMVLSPPATANTKAGPIRANYTAQLVAASTYVIHGPLALPNPENQGFMNNPSFIIGDDGIIIVDSGSTVQVGEMVLDIIRSISDLPIIATFSTHIHGDHWLGNQAISHAFPNAVHYAHPKLIEQANAGEGNAWVESMMTLTDGASSGTVYIAPTEPINDGDIITLAGKTFSIHHDELAHTNTDVAIVFNDEKVMFLGDTAMNGRLGRIDDGSFKGLICFLDRLLEMDIKVYVPGHGQTGSRTVVIGYKNLIETIFQTVRDEYENGLADFEIKPIIEAKIINKAHWSDLSQALGRYVSMAYLEAEEDAF